MRCLFVVDDHPISPYSPGGGPVLIHSRLELMAHSPFEVHLLILRDARQSYGFQEYVDSQPQMWKKVKGWCASHQMIDLVPTRKTRVRLRGVRRLILAFRDPARFLFTTLNRENIAAFQEVMARVEPDVIWAENLIPAILASQSSPDVPLVYSHLDWIARLLKIQSRHRRDLTWHLSFRFWLMDRVERSLVRRSAGCLSGSVTECAQLERMSAGAVSYVPTSYPAADISNAEQPIGPGRIVHVGGMATVANRVGLQRFLEVAWPVIRGGAITRPELWIIGDMENAPDGLLADLKKEGAVLTGLRELGSVLRPYDINVVPWEYNTGTRTKIPLLLNLAQVVVSTRAAAACLPEVRDGQDCVMVDNLQEMGRKVLMLLGDADRRRQIGEAARRTFLQNFTRESLQPRFDQFLSSLALAHRSPRGRAAGSPSALRGEA